MIGAASFMAPPDLHNREWAPGKWLSFNPFNGAGLPAAPGVYVFFFNGTPVYIGSTNKLKNRLWQHRFTYTLGNSQKTPWGREPPETIITGKLRVSRRYGDWAMHELRLIRALRPRFNLHHVTRKTEVS